MCLPHRASLTLSLSSWLLEEWRTRFLPRFCYYHPFPQALLSPVLSFTFRSCYFFPRMAFLPAFSHIQDDRQSVVPRLSPHEGFVVLIPTEQAWPSPTQCLLIKWQKDFKFRRKELKITGSLILYPQLIWNRKEPPFALIFTVFWGQRNGHLHHQMCELRSQIPQVVEWLITSLLLSLLLIIFIATFFV